MKLLLLPIALLTFAGCSSGITLLPDSREFSVECKGKVYLFRVDTWQEVPDVETSSGFMTSFNQLCMPSVYSEKELDSIMLSRWYPWAVDMKNGEFVGHEGLTVRVRNGDGGELDTVAFLHLAATRLLHDFREIPRDVCHGRRLTVAAYTLAAVDRMIDVPYTGTGGILPFYLSPTDLGDCSIGDISVSDLSAYPEAYTVPLSRWLETASHGQIPWR